ncbi:MAG TPA: hypothetical protein VL854_02425, partial [Nitrososphaeraceae archaeon]|nr:hypothetical protein [Nitrososphaeraceae archaeon]
IDQSNDVTSTNPNTIHSNNIEVSQIGATTNDCNESGADAGVNDATCTIQVDNSVNSVEQDNEANGPDDAAQTNDFSVLQSTDAENDCNEFEDGANSVLCDIDDSDNDVLSVDQFNAAFGSTGATISQNNEIDGDDALGIPGITQTMVVDNTCGQTGSGTNDATCEFNGDNFIDPLEQSNTVLDADDGTTMTQDNRAVISQVNVAENDCDENTFTDTHDNNAECVLDNDLDNFLGPVDQGNQVEDAQDSSISNQDNNVAVSQDLLTENDCNGTGGNDAQCNNDGFEDGIDIDDFNFIEDIEQFNEATLAGDVSSEQTSDLVIGQSGALINTCDETGGGVSFALCENIDVLNFVGPVSQGNSVDAPNSDSAVQSNGAQITQNLDAVNDCDEEGTGFNFAFCTNNDAINEIIEISQENEVVVGDDAVQSNFVGINQDLQLQNVCDETGVGDNAALCQNDEALNTIGLIAQDNDADGSGDADITQNINIPTINQVVDAENDCDQSDEQSAVGNNDPDCTNLVAENEISQILQENAAQGTHVDDIFQDITASFSQVMTLNNGCDATTFSSGGDNLATCENDFAKNFIGSVEQFNAATGLDDVLINQDSTIVVSQDLSANNDCDTTASSNAICSNDFAGNQITSITQDNTAAGDGFAQISQSNDLTTDQNANLLNSCDESGDGNNDAICFNFDDFTLFSYNSIGPISQTNTASDAAQSDTVLQSNGAQVTQNFQAINDCDEENTGFSDVMCVNFDTSINNIDSITQTNDATTGGDDTVQLSFVDINQDLQLENVCDETGLGDNSAFCGNNYANSIGPVDQSNTATGSGDADFTQNNNMPTINQVITAQNDCDQTDAQSAEGSNFAECGNFSGPSGANNIDSITQTNDATGTHVDDIFQDNTGSFSQVMTLNNGCDATTFTDDGDNSAGCGNDDAQNVIGNVNPVFQGNGATGGDDVLIDQDNILAVSQDLTANNDCDATAENSVICTNDNVQNFIDSISQINAATGDDLASISQNNEATITQKMDLVNSCDESGAGINDAECDTDDAENFIGPIIQRNDVPGADESDAITQSNIIDVTQNLEGTNDCDEANTGDNNAQCSNNISNNIASITQINLVNPGTGIQVEDQSNLLDINQNLVATNDCDETGLGDNNAICTINQSNDIGAISQSNVASSNVLTINQDGQATNNCDDTTSGDNTATCTINLHLVVPPITQTGDETLNIDQHENLVNNCPGTGSCNIDITRTFDPNAIQALLASTTTASATTTDSNSDEDEEETGSQALTLSSLKTAQADTDTGSALTVNYDDNNKADDNTETNDNSGTSTESMEKAESDTSSDTNTVAEGQDNTGDDNTADDDTGDDNTGDDNTGDDNTGDGDNKDSGDDDNTGDGDNKDSGDDDNTGDSDNKDSGDGDNKDSGDGDNKDSGDDDGGDDDGGDDDGGDDISDE